MTHLDPKSTFKFKIRTRGSEEWTTEGSSIVSPESLQKIADVLENGGPIYVKHSFYRGGANPNSELFYFIDDFTDYLRENAASA